MSRSVWKELSEILQRAHRPPGSVMIARQLSYQLNGHRYEVSFESTPRVEIVAEIVAEIAGSENMIGEGIAATQDTEIDLRINEIHLSRSETAPIPRIRLFVYFLQIEVIVTAKKGRPINIHIAATIHTNVPQSTQNDPTVRQIDPAVVDLKVLLLSFKTLNLKVVNHPQTSWFQFENKITNPCSSDWATRLIPSHS